MGPWICTNFRARSSPVVVTVTLRSPFFTGAVNDASAADAVDGHLYQAIGPPTMSAMTRRGSQRLRSVCIDRSWTAAVVREPGGNAKSHHLSSDAYNQQYNKVLEINENRRDDVMRRGRLFSTV